MGENGWFFFEDVMVYWLVVGPPLWKIWKSIGMIIPNINGKIKNVPNHQPVIYWYSLQEFSFCLIFSGPNQVQTSGTMMEAVKPRRFKNSRFGSRNIPIIPVPICSNPACYMWSIYDIVYDLYIYDIVYDIYIYMILYMIYIYMRRKPIFQNLWASSHGPRFGSARFRGSTSMVIHSFPQAM